ncbi:MAG: hypothetical protein ACU0BF_06885 [Paracoccaceae bacterium]
MEVDLLAGTADGRPLPDEIDDALRRTPRALRQTFDFAGLRPGDCTGAVAIYTCGARRNDDRRMTIRAGDVRGRRTETDYGFFERLWIDGCDGRHRRKSPRRLG